jgi:hypothetical protein
MSYQFLTNNPHRDRSAGHGRKFDIRVISGISNILLVRRTQCAEQDVRMQRCAGGTKALRGGHMEVHEPTSS